MFFPPELHPIDPSTSSLRAAPSPHFSVLKAILLDVDRNYRSEESLDLVAAIGTGGQILVHPKHTGSFPVR
ncbi:hypothetical protein JTE90_015178 [Oedothorax gibbosus]|uniref:Uncharacterized protein n=1 Tax=Oedothorax gibbosus TaxID=931172 RepID=A0AAV6V9Z4_9ARAC|nr:hypothetical protein JTE90_015178 [Oedothorax gibbosus]